MPYRVIIVIDDFSLDDRGLIEVHNGEREIIEEDLSSMNEVAYFLDHFNLLNPHVRFDVYNNETEEIISDKFTVFPYATVMYED